MQMKPCVGGGRTHLVVCSYCHAHIHLKDYLTTHSTHFIYGYMASDRVKDHSDNEKVNPLPPHGLLFPISSKGSFICIIP